MQNKFYTLSAFLLLTGMSLQMNAQLSFTNKNAKLSNANFHSGCAVAVADWNGDGLDDILRLDEGHNAYVEVQQVNQSYLSVYLGDFGAGNSAWAMSVADFDHNGYKDIIADGSGVIRILMTNNTGTGGTFVNLPTSGFFLQNITLADINNDGWIDAFLCDDNAESHVYLNNGSGTLAPSNIINFDVTGTDDSGNYGSVWTDFDNDGDFDLYIAKCRQGVNSPTDGRRIDVLFVNNGNGTFTEDAAAYGLANGWQTWTASFGDIDNDGDLDLMATNHDHESQIFENNGAGSYTDITSTTGFDITDITPIESVLEDFDNDGFMDIIATGSNSRYYKNNGNKTFTRVENLFNSNDMLTFSIGDLNHDGFIDIYAGYGTIYTNPSSIDDVVWMNNKNTNHFFNLNLKGTVSNHDAIGVRATIYGAWGIQIRESRAGESYGTANTAMIHFGLGQATVIDSVVISWPSGITQTIINPSVDQFLTVIENDCVSPTATISLSAAPVLCSPGQSITLTAPAGYNYLWNDGSTTQSITVTQTGEYNVQVSAAGNNCVAQSAAVTVTQSPNQTPVISAAGLTEVCFGSAVQLNGPVDPGIFSYLWSNGDTTQNATITQSGNYTLTIQGYCQQFTSNAISVTVHTVANPVANDVYLTSPGSATLNATGNNISWYDVIGGAVVGTGNTFNTPVLTDTTVYYVQATDIYGGGPVGDVGATYHAGTSLYSAGQYNGATYFDVLSNCTLQSVKVYTDTPGDRNILLKDNSGTIIYNQIVTILPDTQIITLNWALAPGNDYSIETDETYNLNIPGWNQASPQLRRSNDNSINYPYTLANFVQITGNSINNGIYYYFYDWQIIDDALSCSSLLVPVTVFVGPTGISEIADAGISIYPNPANEVLFIDVQNKTNISYSISDYTGRLLKQENTNNNVNKIDISNLNPGIYILRLTVDNQQYVNRFVKE